MARRMERDSLGEIGIPQDRYWGAQTERARQNFMISDYRIPPLALDALAALKEAAAKVNRDLGLLDPNLASSIVQASIEVREGRFPDDFPLDVFQTGSGTSWNMNINEVLASRANEILGFGRGGRSPVHPNDHVNMGQSSNDIIPSVLNISNRLAAANLVDALNKLAASFEERARKFSNLIKIGRTHLQDAVPMTVGQELGAFAAQIRRASRNLSTYFDQLEELPIGGTALGTGLNTHPEFSQRVCRELEEIFSLPFKPTPNTFELIASRDIQVGFWGMVSQTASALMKIAGDLRILASGPRTGLGELILPTLQPGSSIMPGKVNPVIPEMVILAGTHVLGVQTMVAVSNQFATLQLNVMLPLLIYHTVTTLQILTNAVRALDELCVQGLQVDAEKIQASVEWSLAMVTPLAHKLGYDKAAEIAYKAVKENKTVRQVCLELEILPEAELDAILDPASMLGPRTQMT